MANKVDEHRLVPCTLSPEDRVETGDLAWSSEKHDFPGARCGRGGKRLRRSRLNILRPAQFIQRKGVDLRGECGILLAVIYAPEHAIASLREQPGQIRAQPPGR